MIKVGLVGEASNDEVAIRNLLSNPYKHHFQFINLNLRMDGDMLESTGKVKRLVAAELRSRPDMSIIILIRDLDALETNSRIVKRREEWFNKVTSSMDIKPIFLLNIVELEALILADIESFNSNYKTNIKFKGDPMRKMNPKEFLIDQTRNSKKQFKVNDNPELFKVLNVEVVKQNCRYFSTFLAELDALKQ